MTAPAQRIAGIELSLIRQINALATPQSVNLGIGEPNIEPDARLREMAAQAARTGSWAYSPNAGTLALRRLLCEGTPYDPTSEVCVTAGTQEALFALFTAWVDPGDEVLVPDPGFVAYASVARICGAEVVTYPIEPPDWRLDARAVLDRITPKTKLIMVNTPSNPLGSAVEAETLAAIAAAGPLVISDEVYSQIWYASAPPSMLPPEGARVPTNVVVVNGLSKSHAATGLRIGWIHAAAEVMAPVVRAHQYIATCASVFSQSLCEAILADPDWNAAWLKGVRGQFQAQRDAAIRAIHEELEIEIAPPAGAFYAFVPVPVCGTESLARTLATEAGVLVIPGIAFGANGEGFIRLSFASSPERIEEGIRRIGRWLRAEGR